MKTFVHTKLCTWMLVATSFRTALELKTIQMSTNREWMNQMCILLMEVYLEMERQEHLKNLE